MRVNRTTSRGLARRVRPGAGGVMRSARWWLAVGVVGAALWGPASARSETGSTPAASPDPVTEAAAYYEVAMAAMAAESWERAALAFDEAAARDPAAELVWNAARAWDKVGAAAEARDRYVRFLAHDEAPTDLRRFAVKRVEVLTAEVESSLTRARAVEEERLAARVAEELRGELASALAAGRPPVAPAFTARPEPGEGVATAQVTESDSSSVGGWVCAGVGAVGVIVGAVMMAEAARFDHALRDAERDADGVIVGLTQREADALVERRDDAQTIGTAGLAIGGTLLVTGVVWALVASGAERESVAVGVAPGGGVSVVVGRSF